MNPFKPLGERARWLIVYDMLKAAKVNEVVSYREMGDALGLHWISDRGAIQSVMQRAAEEYERVDKRAIKAVRGEGYRVVAPEEQLGLARKHQRRAKKSLSRGLKKVTYVDLSNVDPEVRKAFEITANVLATQADFMRRAERKIEAHEQAINSLIETSDRTEEQRRELQERIEKLEAKMNKFA